MKCPICRCEVVTKKGFRWVAHKKVQQYQCSACGHIFIVKGGDDGTR